MTGAAAVAWFTERFESLGAPSRAVAEKAYLKSELRFHGVTLPQIRKAASDFLKANPSLDRVALLASVDALYASRFHDLRSAALALLEKRAKLLDPSDAEWLISLVRRSPNWAHVDWLASKPLGALVTAHPRLLSKLPEWGRDPELWVRRAAMLAQVDELRAGRGDFALFARIAEPLLEEKEFWIRKAIGWVLREASRKSPERVRDFLLQHGARASGLTFREGSRRLPEQMRREVEATRRSTAGAR